MRNAAFLDSRSCTDKSGDLEAEERAGSENLTRAYLQSPVGSGLRAGIKRSRKLTPAKGLEKAARIALAASMLLEGRGPVGVT